MASFAAKIVAKKLFKENSSNKQGQEVCRLSTTNTPMAANVFQDPYFETVPATRLGFQTKKKLPRALPPGLTAKEEKVLVKAKRRAYKIDMALGSFLGTKSDMALLSVWSLALVILQTCSWLSWSTVPFAPSNRRWITASR